MPTLTELRAIALEHGVEHLGVARADVLERARQVLHERRDAGFDGGMGFTYRNPDRATDPSHSVPGARSVVVGALSYYADDPARPAGPQAKVARYARADHYAPLRAGLRAIARRLKVAGERATVFSDDNGLVDREAAYQAGLGWYGKHANLMVPGRGSWFVLGAVVTTAEFEAAPAPARDGCGTCRRCLDACPTGAIVAPGVVDAGRCLAWVLQRPGPIPADMREPIGDRIYGCDDCQEACPPAIRFGARHPGAGTTLPAWVDVLDLLDADDATLLDRHGAWYIADRDPRWLRRNALVVLGNTGSGADRRTRSTLDRYRFGADEMLAEHAAWAADRLGVDVAGALVAGGSAEHRAGGVTPG